MVRLRLKGLLSDFQHHREALLDRYGDTGGHLRRDVPVVGAQRDGKTLDMNYVLVPHSGGTITEA